MGARADAVLTSGLFVALFAIYAAGSCPTIYVGDSGELVTAVHILGIPHPSGYPLYVLLGKLWTIVIPIGSIAFRMSLFSAACAAAACSILYRLCRAMAMPTAAAMLAALLLAFSPSFWAEANVQRVYALNALFLTAATALAWRWLEDRSPGSLVLAFLLCGLGASNHLFMGVFAICLGVFMVAEDPSILRRWRLLSACAAAALAGLLPYLYLPLRSRANPPLDWGDPETLPGFLRVVFRENFWERSWIESPRDLLAIGWDYAFSLARESGWAGPALAALGMVALWRRRRFAVLPVLVMAANFGAMALHGSRTDIFVWHRYDIPSYAMLALLAGAGCGALQRVLPRRIGPALLAIPLSMLITGWSDNDRSRYRIADDFSGSVLRSMPPGAHLIATDDNILFTLMYLHFVEGMRPDVDLILQGVGNPEIPPLKFNPDVDPVHLTHHPNWNIPGLLIVPVGLTFRAWREGRPLPEPVLPAARLAGEEDPRVPKDHLTQNLIGQFHYMLGVTFEERDWIRARLEFERAAAASPDNDVLFYNLGLIFRRNGLLDDSLAAFRRSHAINPRHLASASRPRASSKIEEVAAEKERLDRIEGGLASDPSLQGVPPGSADYHIRLAALLEARGEPAAARGHRLRAIELRPTR